MSKIPNQVGKGIIKAASTTAKVVTGPVKGGMIGHSVAKSSGNGTGGTVLKTAQGVAAGIAHPIHMSNTAKNWGTKPASTGGQPAQRMKQQPGGPPKDVVVNLKKPNQ